MQRQHVLSSFAAVNKPFTLSDDVVAVKLRLGTFLLRKQALSGGNNGIKSKLIKLWRDRAKES